MDWFDRPNIEVTINLVNVLLKFVEKLDTTINLESLLNKTESDMMLLKS